MTTYRRPTTTRTFTNLLRDIPDGYCWQGLSIGLAVGFGILSVMAISALAKSNTAIHVIFGILAPILTVLFIAGAIWAHWYAKKTYERLRIFGDAVTMEMDKQIAHDLGLMTDEEWHARERATYPFMPPAMADHVSQSYLAGDIRSSWLSSEEGFQRQ